MTGRNVLAAWVMFGLVIGAGGCSSGENKPEEPKGPAPLPAAGPNGGKLFELGSREYVVEIVPASETVSFYLLNPTAKKPAPVTAFEIVVNTKVGGATTEHKVNSQPLKDEIGKSSRFIATDKKMIEAIVAPGTVVEVVLAVGDKKLTGSIKNEGEPPAPTATATATKKPAPSPTAKGTGEAAKPTGSTTATGSGTPTSTATGTAKP
jgi:hypothetical protein